MHHSLNSTTQLVLFVISLTSCTNVSFKQDYDGPKGIDFTKGACVVNDVKAPVSKDENDKLTAMILDYLHEMNRDSVVHIKSLRSRPANRGKIPSDLSSGLIDSLRKYTSYYYLFHVTVDTQGDPSNDIYVNRSEFQDNADSKAYLNNQAVVKITVFDIHANTQLYEQEIIATEMIDTENSLEDDESRVLFTRSSVNVMKNALTRGLRDFRRHSKKINPT
jgi:hypothetical protein